jgi:hypothetical protein
MKSLSLYHKLQNDLKKYVPSALCIIVLTGEIASAQISHSVNFMQSDMSHSTKLARDSSNYEEISMKGLRKSDEIGMPELPVKYVNLLIPSDQGVASVAVSGKQDAEIPGSYKVFPAQKPVPTNGGTLPAFVKPDTSIYSSDDLYPREIVRVVQDGYFDGSNHIVTVAIYPIQYKPKSGKLIFHSSINFQMQPGPLKNKPIQVRQRSARAQEIYNSILKNLVDNPGSIRAYQVLPKLISKSNGHAEGAALQKTTTVSFYEYVIITTNALKPYFSNFVTWKKRKGWDIGIVTTEEIFAQYSGDLIHSNHPIYDNAGKIRQYLSDAYQEGTIWTLLGGGYSAMPIRYGDGFKNSDWSDESNWKIPADLYFADFNGDWNVDGQDPDGYTRYGELNDDSPDYDPEIFVGRIVCESGQEILNWTDKVLSYEINPGNGNTTYLARAFWVEGDDIGIDPSTVSSHYPSSLSNTIWNQNPAHDADQVVAEMSDNYGMLNWHCHGSVTTERVRPEFDAGGNYIQASSVWTKHDYCSKWVCCEPPGDGLDHMTNTNRYSVCYSIGCDNAAFDHFQSDTWFGRCMADGFTTFLASVGGPALLGNTRYGWLGSSQALQRDFGDLLTLGTQDPESGEAYFRDCPALRGDFHGAWVGVIII